MGRSARVLVVLAALTPFVARTDRVLLNGSFEEGPALSTHDVDVLAGSVAITGWTVTGDSIDYLGPPWDVSDGQHAVDLDGRDATFSGIEQTFATAAGQVYLVSFDLSGNPQGGPTVKQVRVNVGDVSHEYAFDSSGQTVEGLIWESVEFPFSASSSSATLSFTSLSATPNSYGPLIDNVAVTAISKNECNRFCQDQQAPCLATGATGAAVCRDEVRSCRAVCSGR